MKHLLQTIVFITVALTASLVSAGEVLVFTFPRNLGSITLQQGECKNAIVLKRLVDEDIGDPKQYNAGTVVWKGKDVEACWTLVGDPESDDALVCIVGADGGHKDHDIRNFVVKEQKEI